MQTTTLHARPRVRGRKSERKRARAEGHVPAVLYGSGSDAELLSVDTAELRPVLRAAAGTTLLIDLAVEGRKEPVKSVLRDVQRHPVTREIVHCDLLKVDLDRKYEVTVPILIEGESIGVKTYGGLLAHHLRDLPIRSYPEKIPEHYILQISDLNIGDSILVRDIPKYADEDFLVPDDVSVVSVAAPRVEAEPGEGEEAAEGAEGEEAAAGEGEEKKEEGEAKADGS